MRVLGFAVQAFAVHAVWMNAGQYAVPVLATVLALADLFRPRIGGSRRASRRIAPSYAGARA